MINFKNSTIKHGRFTEKEFKNLMNGNMFPRAFALLAAIDLPKKKRAYRGNN